jgi:DENN (AEX-3) domain
VLFALPDRTLLLKRPPKNRLPLVDFSYRPLFMCLSIDNVLTLFGCLLTEAKVSTSVSLYIYVPSIYILLVAAASFRLAACTTPAISPASGVAKPSVIAPRLSAACIDTASMHWLSLMQLVLLYTTLSCG